jgi:GTP-binding protein HflX
VELEIPFDHGEVVARAHQEGEVLEESYSERGTRLVARIQPESLDAFGAYLADARG